MASFTLLTGYYMVYRFAIGRLTIMAEDAITWQLAMVDLGYILPIEAVMTAVAVSKSRDVILGFERSVQ